MDKERTAMTTSPDLLAVLREAREALARIARRDSDTEIRKSALEAYASAASPILFPAVG